MISAAIVVAIVVAYVIVNVAVVAIVVDLVFVDCVFVVVVVDFSRITVLPAGHEDAIGFLDATQPLLTVCCHQD